SISWALLRGIDEGVIWAFIAGLFLDLMSVTPIGVTSLSFMFGILAVIWVQQAIPTSRFLLPVILAFSATLVALLVNILLLRTLQLVVDLSALSALFPMTLLHAVLILPVYWTAYWIDRTIRPRKVTV
ncbi:MAG: rod shape-determining protein MreD, partial [Anaerolineales bacterium]|nr:rod shape-determining protein MreD [Anaerolineales bacterium]